MKSTDHLKLELEEVIEECEEAIGLVQFIVKMRPSYSLILFIPTSILIFFVKIAKWYIKHDPKGTK